MSSKIWIATKSVANTFYRHLYFVYDPDGNPTSGDEQIFRGGPSSLPSGGVIWIEDWVDISGSEDALDSDHHLTDRHYTELSLGGLTPLQFKSAISSWAANFGQVQQDGTITTNFEYTWPSFVLNHFYGEVALNSNAVIASALRSVGITDNWLPYIGGNSGSTRWSEALHPGMSSYLVAADEDPTIDNQKNRLIGNVSGENEYTVDFDTQKNGRILIVEDNNTNTDDKLTFNLAREDFDLVRTFSRDLHIHYNPGSSFLSLIAISDVVVYNQYAAGGERVELLFDDDPQSGPPASPSDPDDDILPTPEELQPSPAAERDGEGIPQAEGGPPTLPIGFSDPLVLDLSGNGIDLVSFDSADAVYWDNKADGFREQSAWVGADMGLLAIDLNSNGIIDDNSELFGDTDVYANGFENLIAYDSNSDDVIDNTDTQWDDLIVWVDDNGDGYSQSTELHTLDELLITEIDVAYVGDYQVIAGNRIDYSSTFTMDGQTYDIVDVIFEFDLKNSAYNQDYEFDMRAAALPTLRGYGLVPDLHIAMSLDEDLLELVQDLSMMTKEQLLDDAFDLKAAVEDIVIQWAGAANISPTSRGAEIDAQILSAIENFGGRHFHNDPDSEPGEWAAGILMQTWDGMVGSIAANLLFQAGLGEVVDNAAYNPFTDMVAGFDKSFEMIFIESSRVDYGDNDFNSIYVFEAGDSPISGGGTSILDDGLEDSLNVIMLSGINPIDVDFGLSVNYGTYYLEVYYTSTDKITIASSTGGDPFDAIGTIYFDDGTIMDLTNGLHISRPGSSGSYYGAGTNDTVEGSSSDDGLVAGAGNDILIGHEGTDQLYGDAGNDTYVFNTGDSGLGAYADIIWESPSSDTNKIVIHSVDPDDVKLAVDQYGNVMIKYTSTEEIFIPNAWDYANGGGSLVGEHISEVIFDDETVWDLTNGLHVTYAVTSDMFIGTRFNDVLEGTSANESHQGYNGNDTINGGAGLDYLYGGAGDDTYVFTSGDGGLDFNADVISEYASEGTDTIALENVLTGDVLMWTDSSGNLIVRYSSTDEIAISAGWDYTNGGGSLIGDYVEEIVFDDTTVWDLTNGIHVKFHDDGGSTYGTAYNDTVEGGAGADTLYGHDGNDLIIGGGDSDWYFGGDGEDTFRLVDTSNDNIYDFSLLEDDKIDIADLLSAYDPLNDALSDFAEFADSSGNSILSVDIDGTGSTHSMTQIATLYNITGLDADDLVMSGNLLVA